MSATLLETRKRRPAAALKRGRLTGVDAEGRLLVDYPGNRRGPRVAWLAAPGDARAWRAAAAAGRQVLLLTGRAAGRTPIVAGLLRETLGDPIPSGTGADPLTIAAAGELVLRCGRASITLREDGKIVIQGLDVLSRASRTNKVKGGSVQIN